MKPFLQFVRNLIRFHKLKFFTVILLALMFAVLLFPYDDLGDLVSSRVSEATGGSVFLQFENLSLNFVPSPGVSMEKVTIETAQVPPMSAEKVVVLPWIAGALSARMGGTLDATGIFNGNLAVEFREGDKLKSGVRAQNIDVQAAQIALPVLTEFLRSAGMLSMDLQGSMDMSTALNVDPNFEQQPSGTLGINVAGFTFPSQSVTLQQMGQVAFPTLKFAKLALQGKMSEGRLEIEDLTLGAPKDELYGKIKGDIGLVFQRGPGGVQPVIGAVDMRIDLTASNALLRANDTTPLGLVFKFFDSCKKPAADSTRFIFRMKGNSPIPECLQSI